MHIMYVCVCVLNYSKLSGDSCKNARNNNVISKIKIIIVLAHLFIWNDDSDYCIFI